jgi:hypothetical protein
MSEYSLANDQRWKTKLIAMSEQLEHRRGCPAEHHRPFAAYGDEPSAIEAYPYMGHGGVRVADVVRCQQCGGQIVHRLANPPTDPSSSDWTGPLPAA